MQKGPIAMQAEPTVYIVDDDAPVRSALQLLMKAAGLNAKLYATAQEFLDSISPSARGCLLLDVRMPGMDGLELQKRLAAQNIGLPVILMTGHGDVEMAVRAMKAGAADFIEKPFNNQALLDRVRQCLTYCDEHQNIEEQRAKASERLARLSAREREIMYLLIAGKQNKLIAADLDISVRTVEAHRAKIMEKLHAKTLPEIMRIALLAENTAKQPGYSQID